MEEQTRGTKWFLNRVVRYEIGDILRFGTVDSEAGIKNLVLQWTSQYWVEKYRLLPEETKLINAALVDEVYSEYYIRFDGAA